MFLLTVNSHYIALFPGSSLAKYIIPDKVKESFYFQMTEVEVVSDFKTAARTVLRQVVL